MDDRFRTTSRAARAEVEAALDVAAELAALHVRATTNAAAPVARPLALPRRRRSLALLGAAAAVAGVLGAAVWFDSSSDTIRTTPGTTLQAVVAEQTVATTASSATASATTLLETPSVPSTVAESPTQAVDWRDLAWADTGIGGACVASSVRCTHILHDSAGTPVTFEFGGSGSDVLTLHSTPPVVATLPEGYGDTSSVVATGPDGVIYLQVDPAIRSEEARDIVAVSLVAGDAGREVGRWDRVAPLGRSERVPAAGGLVDCCGTSSVLPPPDAPVVVPWVDRTGASVPTTWPTISVEVVLPTLTVERKDPGATRTWSFEPVGGWTPTGMPRVTPTFDGGFVAILDGADGIAIARGYAGGEVDQVLLDGSALVRGIEAVDPSGRFLVQLEVGGFARVDPFPGSVATWGGRVENDENGEIRLLDVDAAVDSGPAWAADPVAFAAAVAGEPAVGEQRRIDAALQRTGEWLVTVTTSNLMDDSVFAARWDIVVEADTGGRFRFVSGWWGQACQPGRGHQDFRSEPCV